MEDIFDFHYNFGDEYDYNAKKYFVDKLKELKDTLENGDFVIGPDGVDASRVFQEEIAEEILGKFFDGLDVDINIVDGIVTNENAERLFDSIYSQVQDRILRRMERNLDELGACEIAELEEEKLENLKDFLENHESKAIDTSIDTIYTTDRLNTIFKAEQHIGNKAGQDRSTWICPDLGILKDPNISDDKAALILSAQKDNINIRDLVESIGLDLKDINYGDLSEIYGCALDCKEQTGKKLVSYGSFVETTEIMQKNQGKFSENTRNKINERMTQIRSTEATSLDDIISSKRVQFDANRPTENKQVPGQDR